MNADNKKYQQFDLPEIGNFLFHPRKESGFGSGENKFEELSIPVENDVTIGARFYPCEKQSPVLLFFHGNGEIVADYDDIGQFYQRMNINFFPVDYRGYGISSGSPSVSSMMEDCTKIFDYAVEYLKSNNYEGAKIIMGRSLGSASALELVTSRKKLIDGLVIESGFAFALPLLSLLGVDLKKIGVDFDAIENHQKIKEFNKPTLIIHAEHDHIIPFTDGEVLFQHSADSGKKLLKIPGANHNDILARGLEAYMQAVKALIERAIIQHADN